MKHRRREIGLVIFQVGTCEREAVRGGGRHCNTLLEFFDGLPRLIEAKVKPSQFFVGGNVRRKLLQQGNGIGRAICLLESGR